MYCVFLERKTETTESFVFCPKLERFETQSHMHTVLCSTLYDVPFYKCYLIGNDMIDNNNNNFIY